jgi:NAD(P)-dependent dehydrogenase (short-subunit alcohol dehydrogenase family)
MQSLKNKVAIITGGSRGIGRAVAKQLGAMGAKVAVNFVGNAEAAHAVVKDIEAMGGVAKAIQADASKVADIKRLFAEVETSLGKPDIVILAPGAFVMKPLAAISEDEFDRVFALNTRGVFFALQEATNRMNDGGTIISLSIGCDSITEPQRQCLCRLQSSSRAVHFGSGTRTGQPQYLRQHRVTWPHRHRRYGTSATDAGNDEAANSFRSLGRAR